MIEADSARAIYVADPRSAPTDPTGRSSGRDHRPLNGLARGDRNTAAIMAHTHWIMMMMGIATKAAKPKNTAVSEAVSIRAM